MLRYCEDTPQWARTMFERYETRLGLALWDIHVKTVDAPGGNPYNSGSAFLHTTYRRATIEINRKLQDTRVGRDTIVHELWHVALALVDQVCEKATERYIDKKSEDFFIEDYTDAQEATIETLVRADREYTQRDSDIAETADQNPFDNMIVYTRPVKDNKNLTKSRRMV